MTERRRVPVGKDNRPQAFNFGDGANVAEVAEAAEPCGCPALEREDWDGVESDWTDIAFLRTTSNAVLGVPVGFGGVREELRTKAAALGLTVPDDAMLLLGAGRFRRPVMLEVEAGPAEVRGIERPGGVAYTRMINAPWGAMARSLEQVREEAIQRYGRAPEKLWIWYLTCSVCSGRREFETLFIAHYREAP